VLVPELTFARINSAFGRVDEITEEIEIDRIAEVNFSPRKGGVPYPTKRSYSREGEAGENLSHLPRS